MDLELRGKRAVITGGSVGIGLAVAHALARGPSARQTRSPRRTA